MPASLKRSKVGFVTKPEPLECCKYIDQSLIDGWIDIYSIKIRGGAMFVTLLQRMEVVLLQETFFPSVIRESR